MKCVGVSSVRADDNGVGAELKAEHCRGEQPGKGDPEGGMVFHAYLDLGVGVRVARVTGP